MWPWTQSRLVEPSDPADPKSDPPKHPFGSFARGGSRRAGGLSDAMWHFSGAMPNAPFLVGMPHETNSMGIVVRNDAAVISSKGISTPHGSRNRFEKRGPRHVQTARRKTELLTRGLRGNDRAVDSSRKINHNQMNRYSPVFLNELELRAQRRRDEKRERSFEHDYDDLMAGFNAPSAPVKEDRASMYDERGKLINQFRDANEPFEPTIAQIHLVQPPFIPAGRSSREPTQRKPCTASPRASKAVIELRKAVTLESKPARESRPSTAPDPLGIWGLSYLGRRGGPIQTRAPNIFATDDLYQRTASALQRSIEFAKLTMDPPPLVEPAAAEVKHSSYLLRIKIEHSMAARTWRAPWRVRMHYEIKEDVTEDIHKAADDTPGTAQNMHDTIVPSLMESDSEDDELATSKRRLESLRANLSRDKSSMPK